MEDTWKSISLYEHPAAHQAGRYGRIVLHDSGVYSFRAGGLTMSCPQDWAAKIHHDEADDTEVTLILRNVPEMVRRELKAACARDGISMQDKILELITAFLKI